MSLRVAVVGAGIAGLCTALMLREKGIAVTVYEKEKGLNEAGAGIQIPPNASIHLARLGLINQLKQQAFEPRAIQLRRYATSELLHEAPSAPFMEQVFGYPYLLIHRRDYQRILYDAAVAAGIDIVFAAEIESVDGDEPAILFKGSRKITVDLIIGADGVNSSIRGMMASSSAVPIISSHRAYRALILTELMKAIPFGSELLDSRAVNVWLGPRKHVVGYRISDTHYNIVMIHPGQVEATDSWTQRGSIEQMNATYADFDPQLRSVLSLVSDVRAWKLTDMPELLEWTFCSGKVVLIGDAAHAMLPYAAQGAAQAVEDAAALASCLASVHSPSDLNTCLQVFERLRKERVLKIAALARMNQKTWELPDGPEQHARDQKWKSKGKNQSTEDSQKVGSRSSASESSKVATQDESPEAEFMKWMWGTDARIEAEAALARQSRDASM